MRVWLGLGVLALALAGCGKSDDASNAKGGSGGTGGAADSGLGGAAGAPCSEDPSTLTPDAVCILDAHGSVVDGTGAPVPDLQISVCGPVCFYGQSDATGAFDVLIGFHLPPTLYSTEPHGRPGRTSFYYALPQNPGQSVDVGQLRVLDLPATGPTLVVKSDKQGAPAQTVTSGDVTLDVAAGVSVKLDVEDVALHAEGKLFRALPIPKNLQAEFADAKLGLVGLWAFTPFEAAFVDETTLAPAKAQLSAENSFGLPAGSAVEWLALGSYLFSDWVKPAAFEVIATGTVSADGTSIAMDTGQGTSYLTWVGVRAKP